MRRLVVLLAILAIGIGAYFVLRDDGLLDRVTEDRVQAALLANGVPENMATCMAPKLVDGLSIAQLRALERLAPEEGEERIPRSGDAVIDRLQRVDDEKAVRVLVSTGTDCGIEILRERLGEQFERLQ